MSVKVSSCLMGELYSYTFLVQTKAGNATGFILLGAARFLTHVCESPNSCHQLPLVACGNLT